MAVAWPLVKGALVAGMPAVVGPSVRVFDGTVVTGESPAAYVTVGSAPSVGDDGAGAFSQSNGPDGFSATETGTVVAECAAVTGSTTVPDVWAMFEAITSWVQADMTLGGVLTVGSTVTVTVTVVQAQTRSGAAARLVLTFDYLTQI